MKKTKYILAFVLLFFASASIFKLNDWIEPSFSSPSQEAGSSVSLRFDKLAKTLYHVQEQYVDPDRVSPKEMLKKVLEYLSLGIAEVTVQYPTDGSGIITVKDAKKDFDLNIRNIFALQSSIMDAAKFVLQNKISDIRQDELESLCISAVLATLDPHSLYLSKENYEETKVGTTGQFGGLGIVIGIRDSVLTIISPLEGTPAFRAKLQAGDQIVKIGSEPTESMLLEEAVKKMRGPKGTSVVLSIARKSWTEPKEFKLTRDHISIVSIESELLKDKYGYVRVKTFQEDTTSSLQKHLEKLNERAGGSMKGLILDLRNNPGGLLDQAVGVSDLFIKNGVIVSTVGPKKKILEEERAQEGGTQPDYPIIVLTNRGSASASEIVSGSMQKLKRAVVLGERTFGKATVQQLFSLPPDAALKLTIAKYLNAGSDWIQNSGITPEIKTVAATIMKDGFDIVENREHFREEQLEGHFSAENQESLEKSDITLTYLSDLGLTEEEVPEAVSLSSLDSPSKRAEKLLKDFDILFSQRVLEASKGNTPKDIMKAAEKLSTSVQTEEEDKIKIALSKKGIDWSTGIDKSENCASAPKVSWELVEETKKQNVSTVKAGDKFSLNLRIENTSSCTFHQLKAVTKSKNYLFSDREFLFGKIPPRKTTVRSVSMELPKSSPTGLIPIEVMVSDATKTEMPTVHVEIPVQAVATPEFAFSYSIRGPVEIGKSFDVDFMVKNIGKQTSQKATIALKPEEGVNVSIKRNRMPISDLKPGQEKTFSFNVSVPSASRDGIYLNLEIADFTYRSYVTKKLNIAMNAQPIAKSSPFISPSIQIQNEKILFNPQNDKFMKLNGSIKGDSIVKDMYILVNQKKVHYTHFDAKQVSSSIPFESELPLEIGENQITIVARDNSDLLGRKSYMVFRPEPKKPN